MVRPSDITIILGREEIGLSESVPVLHLRGLEVGPPSLRSSPGDSTF